MTDMPSAQNSVVINRPLDAVFAFVTDGMNGATWRSGVLDTEHVSGTGAGAVYRQGVKGPGGRRIAADYEVTAFEPGRRMAFRTIAGPVRPTGELRFEPAAGGTRVTFSLDAALSGWKKLLMGGVVQKTMDAEVHALDRLKGVLEA
jgi:uncharacterized membrane protein